MTDETTSEVNQPDELGNVKEIVKEYLSRRANVENEISGLKEDLKNLNVEFKKKIDMKTLKAALHVIKIEAGIQHKDTYDQFIEVLKGDEANGLVD
jgi:uncharacterized protein (UPF0335 family)